MSVCSLWNTCLPKHVQIQNVGKLPWLWTFASRKPSTYSHSSPWPASVLASATCFHDGRGKRSGRDAAFFCCFLSHSAAIMRRRLTDHYRHSSSPQPRACGLTGILGYGSIKSLLLERDPRRCEAGCRTGVALPLNRSGYSLDLLLPRCW